MLYHDILSYTVLVRKKKKKRKKNKNLNGSKEQRFTSCLYHMTSFDRMESMVVSLHVHLRIQTEAEDTIWSNVFSYCHEKLMHAIVKTFSGK